jgi:serine/threonine protein kinase
MKDYIDISRIKDDYNFNTKYNTEDISKFTKLYIQYARKIAQEQKLARKIAQEQKLARKIAQEQQLARKKAQEQLARKIAQEQLARKIAQEQLARKKAVFKFYTRLRTGGIGHVDLYKNGLNEYCVGKSNNDKSSIKHQYDLLVRANQIGHPDLFVKPTFISSDKKIYGMEYLLNYSTLWDKIKRFDVPDDLKRTWYDKLVLAVNTLHENHIAHRDLKPTNIMVKDDGSLKLIDFGSACYGDYGCENLRLITTDGYFPPSVRPGQFYDFKTSKDIDLFALKVIKEQLRIR